MDNEVVELVDERDSPKVNVGAAVNFDCITKSVGVESYSLVGAFERPLAQLAVERFKRVVVPAVAKLVELKSRKFHMLVAHNGRFLRHRLRHHDNGLNNRQVYHPSEA